MGGGCGCRGGVLKSNFMMILELNQMKSRAEEKVSQSCSMGVEGFQIEGTQSAFAHQQIKLPFLLCGQIARQRVFVKLPEVLSMNGLCQWTLAHAVQHSLLAVLRVVRRLMQVLMKTVQRNFGGQPEDELEVVATCCGRRVKNSEHFTNCTKKSTSPHLYFYVHNKCKYKNISRCI